MQDSKKMRIGTGMMLSCGNNHCHANVQEYLGRDEMETGILELIHVYGIFCPITGNNTACSLCYST